MPAVNYFPLFIWRRLLDKLLREEGAYCWALATRKENRRLWQAIARHLAALSRFYLDAKNARSGLVLGYGNTSAAHFIPALRTLNRLIGPFRRG